MNIGIMVPRSVSDGAICHGDLCRYFISRGIESHVYGYSNRDEKINDIFVPFELSQAEDPRWWQEKNMDMVILYTHTGFSPKAIAAAKTAKVKVLIEADSDGKIDYERNIVENFVRQYDSRRNFVDNLRNLKAATSVAASYNQKKQHLLESYQNADYIKFENHYSCDIAKEIFLKFGAKTIADKLVTIPFAVRDEFITQPLGQKKKVIVVAGRLDAQQKDPVTLCRTIKEFSKTNAGWEFYVCSRGSTTYVDSQLKPMENVRLFNDLSRPELQAILREAPILLTTSRYESTPIQALEALCTGTTIVAPPLPSMFGLLDGGKYGTIAQNRSPKKIADALEHETAMWNNGQRNAEQIALIWRQSVSLASVGEQFIALAQ